MAYERWGGILNIWLIVFPVHASPPTTSSEKAPVTSVLLRGNDLFQGTIPGGKSFRQGMHDTLRSASKDSTPTWHLAIEEKNPLSLTRERPLRLVFSKRNDGMVDFKTWDATLVLHPLDPQDNPSFRGNVALLVCQKKVLALAGPLYHENLAKTRQCVPDSWFLQAFRNTNLKLRRHLRRMLTPYADHLLDLLIKKNRDKTFFLKKENIFFLPPMECEEQSEVDGMSLFLWKSALGVVAFGALSAQGADEFQSFFDGPHTAIAFANNAKVFNTIPHGPCTVLPAEDYNRPVMGDVPGGLPLERSYAGASSLEKPAGWTLRVFPAGEDQIEVSWTKEAEGSRLTQSHTLEARWEKYEVGDFIGTTLALLRDEEEVAKVGPVYYKNQERSAGIIVDAWRCNHAEPAANRFLLTQLAQLLIEERRSSQDEIAAPRVPGTSWASWCNLF